MKFTAAILCVALGAVAVPQASAFSTAFSHGVVKSAASRSASISKANTHPSGCGCASCASTHSPGCGCNSCAGAHPANCDCFTCSGGFALRMSTVEEAEAVPAEVEAMDGVASEEEAHNVERPARGSGIHKHHKDDKADRTELKDLEIGAEVTAKVKTITSYGAFLDIGAKSDALIHVSRLSDEFVANVEDVVKQGEEIAVRIVSVDTDKNQVAVTMRSAEAEAKASEGASSGRPAGRRRERPGRSGADQAAQAASINALAEKGFDDEKMVGGEVVSSLDFGAFVRFDTAQLGEGFEGEVDGLVHISALAEGRTNAVSDVVAIGDKVQVRVRTVDTDAGRVSLSMITKEQEEASRPPRREGGGGGGGRGGGNFSPVENNWKNTGAADWKEQLDEFAKVQPGFTNTAVVQDRRKP
ncbi:hypothetical protein ACHAXT_000942 [Thalassiosira profunda]